MRTNQEWLEYFETNSKNRLQLGDRDVQLTAEERERISSSIQAFQIGEASEGKCLREKAKSFSEVSGDARYPELIGYLIREENRHSAYLGHFMRLHGIPLKRKNWTDSAFRFIRNVFNLEVSIRVLVTAELIAVKYYRALSVVTGSPLLRDISNRMLEEEAEHIRFQMATIHKINALKHPLFSALSDILHALLLIFTICVVWREHKPVLQATDTFKSFFSGVYDLFREAMDYGREAAFESYVSSSVRQQEKQRLVSHE